MDVFVRVDSLTKRFGGTPAVDGLSFDVRRGEIFGFLGPNGAGKTTSIRMMSGLLKPDGGRVDIRFRTGVPSVGVCPQNIVVWENLTCGEQLVYMGRMQGLPAVDSRRRSGELLESFGLTEKRNRLAKTLSGGMRRRLNIALALVHSPEIVFLDEPQAGLDPQSRVLVRDVIRSLKNRTTVILTTHDMEEAEKLSDRVCIIDRGRLLALGTTEEIKKAGGQEDVIEIGIEGSIGTELVPFLGPAAGECRVMSENTARFRIGAFSALEAILGVIRDRKIRVHDLHLRRKSLEDVFIGMTGRSLRE
jgi:ABC-2 type transport system ATP-binding protein